MAWLDIFKSLGNQYKELFYTMSISGRVWLLHSKNYNYVETKK